MTGPAHRISIDRLATRARIGASDPMRAQARLFPVLTEAMPRAFAEAADQLLQDRNEVIRIRKLVLHLDDPHAAGGSTLADLIARALTDELARALSERPREAVRVWPDRAAYCASFALFRLGLTSEPDWAFPDFAAYTALTGPQAAMAVLVGGGATGLLAVARLLRDLGVSATDLVLRLQPEDMSGLLTDCNPLLASSDDENDMCTALSQIQSAWFRVPVGVGPFARALAALLDVLTGTEQATSPNFSEVSQLARAALALAAITEAQMGAMEPEILLSELLAGNVPSGSSAGAAQLALARLLRHRSLRKLLREFAVVGLTGLTTAKSIRTAPHDPRPAIETDGTDSRLAGFALLLPLVQRLRLDTTGPPETLRLIALAALGLSDTDLAAQDPGLSLLVPADPRCARVLPDAPPAAELWRTAGSLAGAARHISALPLDIWSDLWLATFAAQLPGLQDSSPAYLRRQFLHRTGFIHQDASRITVTLAALPLGIVLRMAGLLGSRGAIAHLGNRTLIIALEPDR